MLCLRCKSEMILDDKDFNFDGNYDNYWLCEDCEISCVEEVRYHQSFCEIWDSEIHEEFRNHIVKKPIIVKGKTIYKR